MAYTPKSQLEDQNQPGQAPASSGAPTTSAPGLGSTASFGGTAGNVGAGGLAQQGVQSQGGSPGGSSQAGTGYLNIDRVLGANQNAGANVQSAFNTASNTERGNFDAARTGFANQAKAYDVSIDPGALAKSVAAGDKNAYGRAGNVLNTTYNSPNQLSYNVGGSKESKDMAGLSNAQTAGQTLAANAGPLANYNPGLSAIDQAIYGSAQNKPMFQNLGAQKNNLQQDEQNGIEASKIMANYYKNRVATNKSSLTDALRGQASSIQSQADAKAQAANAQQASDLANHVLRDPNTGQVVQAAPGQVFNPTGWEAGSTGNATGANFLGSNVGGLNAIGKLLGDQNLANMQAGPAWVSGRNTTVAAPPGEFSANPNAELIPLTPAPVDTTPGSKGLGDSEVKRRTLNPDGSLAT